MTTTTSPTPEPAAAPAFELAIRGEIRDKQQLELQFHYALARGEGAHEYVVDTYLFVPKNVGVHRANYSRDDFYRDVTALIRLDAAPLPLVALADATRVTSPMYTLHRLLDEFRRSPRPPDSRDVIAQVKLYAYLFTTAVRERFASLVARAAAAGAADEDGGAARGALEDDVNAAMAEIRNALVAYRSLRGAFWPFEKLCDEAMPDALRSADEYMSVYLDESVAIFVAGIERIDLGDGVTRARLRSTALLIAREEVSYRRKYGYLTFSHGQAGGEYFGYHSSLLKKTVQQALYLDPRAVKADTFVRNGVGAVGAALAAIWALAAQIPLQLAQASGGTKTILFAIPVVAYVMKDRIKALTNELLIAKFRRFDHTAWLAGPGLRSVGLGMLRARIREVMKFLDVEKVPAEVRSMRATHRTVQHAEPAREEVIHYRKVIEVLADKEARSDYWVRDIFRLNVRHFLVRLDDARDQIGYFDAPAARFRFADIPKVYHLNAIVRLSRRTADGAGHERLERTRIVIDKSGIVRTEVVDVVGPRPLPATNAKRPLRLPFKLRK